MFARLLPFALVFPVGCWLAPVQADTVEISGGGHLAGKVLYRNDKDVGVLIDDEIFVRVQNSRVARVIQSESIAEYAAKARECGNDPEAHYQLAIWCKDRREDPSRSLLKQSRYHMQRVIALDPDHAAARAALGYVSDGGQWILYSQERRNRGLILSNGRWVFPEAVAAERMRDEANVKANRWVKDVARIRTTYLKALKFNKPESSVAALDEMKGIRDPLAADAIAGELEKSRGNSHFPRELRKVWVRLLGQYRNSASVRALVLTGIDEPDADVREMALEELKEYGSRSAVMTYAGMLKPPNKNSVVRRALVALKTFPDRELAEMYIDALVTSHKTVKAPGPGTQAGFTQDGSGGFSTGSKPVVKTDFVRNQPARDLLREIAPEVDFGYDKDAWRAYFASQLTTYEGNLRRDP